MAGIFDRKESMDGLAEQLKPRFMTRGERVSVWCDVRESIETTFTGRAPLKPTYG